MSTAISYGSSGPDVKNLQELLNNFLPSSHLNLDGQFGVRTEAAVRVFQASIGIGIDGVAGPITLEALKKGAHTSHTVDFPPSVNVKEAPWMTVAMGEIGQKEIRGPRHNPRIIEYHAATSLKASTDETAWCSSFVNWCLRQVSITGTNSAAAIRWINWGKAATPKEGAITVIHQLNAANSGYHVAFFLQDCGSHHRLLGGNQSNRVKSSLYPKASWRIVAQRWPT